MEGPAFTARKEDATVSTQLSHLADQAQKWWAPMLIPELLEVSLLPALVNKQYEGEIKPGGNTVRVSQLSRPTAVRKTAGANEDTFESERLSSTYVDLVADQVITAAVELSDLAALQTQIGQDQSAIRQAMTEALMIEVNNYLYSLVSPSTSAPDHVVNGVSDFNATQVANCRMRASQAKWKRDGGWWLLCDPSYYNDMLAASTLTSGDFVDDAPVVGGQISKQRFGFNILEDNSAAMASTAVVQSTAGADYALAFHPDFMLSVMGAPQYKLSDLHSQKRHGYLLSATIIMGAKLGIDGAVKHQFIYNT
jgi:hypothetical protein